MYHWVIVYDELIVELDVAVDLLYNIVLNQDKAVDSDVYCKPICVKACTYLFIDFDEDVVCGLLDWTFAVFFGHWVDKFELL